MEALIIPPGSKRILCVEDDPDSSEVLRILLRHHDVSTAATMNEALEQARGERFDLYVLAGDYPDGSGVELCRQLRANDARTPVLFLSSRSDDSDVREEMRVGAQEYLIKPQDLDVLGEVVDRIFMGGPVH